MTKFHFLVYFLERTAFKATPVCVFILTTPSGGFATIGAEVDDPAQSASAITSRSCPITTTLWPQNPSRRQVVYCPRRGNSLGVGGRPAQHNVEQPTSGGLEANLLEAEVIRMQYLYTKQRGFVLAAAESEKVLGKKQFHRANYYLGKT